MVVNESGFMGDFVKIDVNEFRVHEPLILKQYDKDGIDCVSLYAATAMVPVIALYIYIREVHPSPEIDRRVASLIEFYDYKEIIGERKT